MFAFGGVQDGLAVFVGALVGASLVGAVLVAFAEHGLHLVGGQLVIAGPRLVASKRGDPAEDRGAVLILALVGVDLRQVDLGELGSLALISSAVSSS